MASPIPQNGHHYRCPNCYGWGQLTQKGHGIGGEETWAGECACGSRTAWDSVGHYLCTSTTPPIKVLCASPTQPGGMTLKDLAGGTDGILVTPSPLQDVIAKEAAQQAKAKQGDPAAQAYKDAQAILKGQSKEHKHGFKYPKNGEHKAPTPSQQLQDGFEVAQLQAQMAIANMQAQAKAKPVLQGKSLAQVFAEQEQQNQLAVQQMMAQQQAKAPVPHGSKSGHSIGVPWHGERTRQVLEQPVEPEEPAPVAAVGGRRILRRPILLEEA